MIRRGYRPMVCKGCRVLSRAGHTVGTAAARAVFGEISGYCSMDKILTADGSHGWEGGAGHTVGKIKRAHGWVYGAIRVACGGGKEVHGSHP